MRKIDTKIELHYKGFIASCEYDANVMEYYGVAKKKNDIIHFHSYTIDELVKSFHESVEAHIEMRKIFNRTI